jgi:hypothetical protein
MFLYNINTYAQTMYLSIIFVFRKVLISIQAFTVTRNRITSVYGTCDDYVIDDPQVLYTQEKKPY